MINDDSFWGINRQRYLIKILFFTTIFFVKNLHYCSHKRNLPGAAEIGWDAIVEFVSLVGSDGMEATKEKNS